LLVDQIGNLETLSISNVITRMRIMRIRELEWISCEISFEKKVFGQFEKVLNWFGNYWKEMHKGTTSTLCKNVSRGLSATWIVDYL